MLIGCHGINGYVQTAGWVLEGASMLVTHRATSQALPEGYFNRAVTKGIRSVDRGKLSASHRYSPAPQSDSDMVVAGNTLLKSHIRGIIALSVSIVILVPVVHSRVT